MAERVHVSVHVAVAAGAGMRRVALFRAGRRGHNSSVTVLMRKFWDGFGLCLAAAGAGEGLDAGLRRGRLLGHFAVVPCVTQSIHISVHIAVAAGAGVGRIALGRARRRGDDCLVAVFVRELRDGFRLRRAAARAGIGPDAGLRLCRLLRHFAVVPCVTQSGGIAVAVALAAGAGVRRVPLFGAGRRGHNILVAVGMGNIIVMDVGGQKVIISIGRNRDRFPLRLAPGIVHIGQRCAVTESPSTNARHAVRNRHTGQRCAIIESTPVNARHAVRDRHAGQR